ncbi:hypothetical protein Tco_1288687 [Tanacetum coccineum]
MDWVLLMLPLSYSASKLETVEVALFILSSNSLWTTLSPTFSGGPPDLGILVSRPLLACLVKSANIKSLCEKICNIVVCVNLDHLNQLLLIRNSDEMVPNLYVLGLPKTIKPTELDVVVLLKRQVADEDG